MNELRQLAVHSGEYRFCKCSVIITAATNVIFVVTIAAAAAARCMYTLLQANTSTVISLSR